MNLKERFLKYITFETQADPESKEVPSSRGQISFAEVLLKELKEIGISDVEIDDKSYIYGRIPSNIPGVKQPLRIAFIAHMDTAANFPGPGNTARVIENYDGNEIELASGIFLRPQEHKALKDAKGDTLIVTNGKTLLGGDDKSGIAEIMTALAYLTEHPEELHGDVAFVFTPDEEIGGSTKHVDLEKLSADVGYTLDGEEFGTIEYENFCNGVVQLEFRGIPCHPGYAKGIMVNALNLAAEFHGFLPTWDRPEHSCGYEGFFHLVMMEGNVEKSKSAYLIKEFDIEQYQKRKERMAELVSYLNHVYGEGTVTAEFLEGKMNMASLIAEHQYVVDFAKEEIANCGVEPSDMPLRGGTDGVALTFMGLPCPNLGTGSYNHHSIFEFANLQKMEKCCELVLKLIRRYASENKTFI